MLVYYLFLRVSQIYALLKQYVWRDNCKFASNLNTKLYDRLKSCLNFCHMLVALSGGTLIRIEMILTDEHWRRKPTWKQLEALKNACHLFNFTHDQFVCFDLSFYAIPWQGNREFRKLPTTNSHFMSRRIFVISRADWKMSTSAIQKCSITKGDWFGPVLALKPTTGSLGNRTSESMI